MFIFYTFQLRYLEDRHLKFQEYVEVVSLKTTFSSCILTSMSQSLGYILKFCLGPIKFEISIWIDGACVVEGYCLIELIIWLPRIMPI